MNTLLGLLFALFFIVAIGSLVPGINELPLYDWLGW